MVEWNSRLRTKGRNLDNSGECEVYCQVTGEGSSHTSREIADSPWLALYFSQQSCCLENVLKFGCLWKLWKFIEIILKLGKFIEILKIF